MSQPWPEGEYIVIEARKSTVVDCEQLAELIRAFEAVEWAATRWTDYPACPFCGRLEDGEALNVTPYEKYPPRTHKPDCRWVRNVERWREFR